MTRCSSQPKTEAAAAPAKSASHSVWLALLAGAAAASVFGWLLQRVIYRPILGRGPLVPLIASIGVFIAMEEVFRLVFGPYPHDFAATVGLPTVHVGGAVVTVSYTHL